MPKPQPIQAPPRTQPRPNNALRSANEALRPYGSGRGTGFNNYYDPDMGMNLSGGRGNGLADFGALGSGGNSGGYSGGNGAMGDAISGADCSGCDCGGCDCGGLSC